MDQFVRKFDPSGIIEEYLASRSKSMLRLGGVVISGWDFQSEDGRVGGLRQGCSVHCCVVSLGV